MTEIHDLTAIQQVTAVRRRELSPVEITEHYLARIERLNDRVGAYITVAAEQARRQARLAEQRLVSGPPDDRPPALLGLPVPIKDLDMVAGLPWTRGSGLFAGQRAPEDEAFVARLRHAGAVFIGKTNTPEFGLPCYTENEIAPPARTPWDLTCSAGGSSGGAAAAVAAGLAPVAQGSDGGGSIRIPASVCGLFGIKPSRGRVSAAPRRSDLLGLATTGPLARTVRDAALLLDALAVSVPGDHYTAPALPGGRTFLEQADRDPGRLRVARFSAPPVSGVRPHPDVLAAYESATALLSGLGHDVEEIDTPFDDTLFALFEEVWAGLASAAPVPPGAEDRLQPITRWLRERADRSSIRAFLTAAAGLQQAVRAALPRLAAYDAVLTPTLASPPVPVGHFTAGGPAQEYRAMVDFTPYTSMYNVTGQPAVNVPLHVDGAGRPIGVMLAGRPGDEATLIALSAQLEAARPWHGRTPRIWSA
ncbi:amidase [Marinitenerispora sediminis]|uniref:Amidase n=1 Tax=Marinitenerispora sediminis TaxID=1931232 RepID=A0A368T9U7_9ACTN|nr:amidase [Marinitenerispora sediminis]RCV53822.1 amidase [Marinitenerispora sediminis]RCV58222.1 amidase [Marinitenerispora sediminis]RCV61482.1 amidase [Marinitenerispora sediminis]